MLRQQIRGAFLRVLFVVLLKLLELQMMLVPLTLLLYLHLVELLLLSSCKGIESTLHRHNRRLQISNYAGLGRYGGVESTSRSLRTAR